MMRDLMVESFTEACLRVHRSRERRLGLIDAPYPRSLFVAEDPTFPTLLTLDPMAPAPSLDALRQLYPAIISYMGGCAEAPGLVTLAVWEDGARDVWVFDPTDGSVARSPELSTPRPH